MEANMEKFLDELCDLLEDHNIEIDAVNEGGNLSIEVVDQISTYRVELINLCVDSVFRRLEEG